MEEVKANEVKENSKSKIETLVGHVADYAETRIDLTLLNTSDKVAATLSSATNAIIVGVFSFFTFLFLSLGLAWWLGQIFNNAAEGYFSVAGIYLLVTVICYIFRRSLFKPLVTNIFLKNIYDK